MNRLLAHWAWSDGILVDEERRHLCRYPVPAVSEQIRRVGERGEHIFDRDLIFSSHFISGETRR